MAISFTRARQLIDDANRADWDELFSEGGKYEYSVSRKGLEDATHFCVEDGNEEVTLLPGPIWLVDKTTGEITNEAPNMAATEIWRKLEAMTPVEDLPGADI